MKKHFLIGAALTLLISCRHWCPGERQERWIEGYYTGELVLKRQMVGTKYDLIELSTPTYEVTVPGEALYDEISARNGDLSYNGTTRGEWMPSTERCIPRKPLYFAFADNFTRMHVTSNADWDEAHPAGTFLDDVLTLSFNSYGTFVRSGYVDTGSSYHEVLISELTPAMMEIVQAEPSSPRIFLPKLDREHTLTVEWTTTEGEVKRASVVCEPRQ